MRGFGAHGAAELGKTSICFSRANVSCLDRSSLPKRILDPFPPFRRPRGVPHLLFDPAPLHRPCPEIGLPNLPQALPRRLPLQVVQKQWEVDLPALPEPLVAVGAQRAAGKGLSCGRCVESNSVRAPVDIVVVTPSSKSLTTWHHFFKINMNKSKKIVIAVRVYSDNPYTTEPRGFDPSTLRSGPGQIRTGVCRLHQPDEQC